MMEQEVTQRQEIECKQAPNDTSYQRWSCHSGLKCVKPPRPKQWGPDSPFLSMRTRCMDGAAARDTTSTYYKTADTDIQHCIQYIINIPHSVLTGDVNAHSTLWHSYTDDHRGQLIADVISNSDHISLNTNTLTRVPNTILQQTSSPDITMVSNTLYNRTRTTIRPLTHNYHN